MSFGESIATRYVLIIASIAHMSQRGEDVGDLALLAVKDCIFAMRQDGIESKEIRKILHDKFEAELALSGQHCVIFRRVLEQSSLRMSMLLSFEQAATPHTEVAKHNSPPRI
ncbi:hypothetical protein [Herbaspirillum frisingense]|uniref:hypothetical protein n=1 Tax=Herbaspirillum frisingense TaxID=92645 RepID=UPI0012678BAA|nr:hypothetical protein [Herbaspirillum frisingense]